MKSSWVLRESSACMDRTPLVKINKSSSVVTVMTTIMTTQIVLLFVNFEYCEFLLVLFISIFLFSDVSQLNPLYYTDGRCLISQKQIWSWQYNIAQLRQLQTVSNLIKTRAFRSKIPNNHTRIFFSEMHSRIRKRRFRSVDGGDEHVWRSGPDRVLRTDRRLRPEKVLRVLLPGATPREILDRRSHSRQSDLVAIGHDAGGHTVSVPGQSDLKFR